MECWGKLESNNQVIDWTEAPYTWLKILYFLFADATDRHRHFADAAAAGHSWSARRLRR